MNKHMDPVTRDFMNKKFNAGIKNFDDLAWDIELHEWQKDGFENVLTRCNRSDEHNVIPVNACVGSGKTFFAFLAIADYIDHHRNEKTIQAFVTPRIKLCKQQRNELIDKISKCGPYNYQNFTEFPGNTDYQIISVDCTNREWNRHNDHLDAKHVVFMICDESLWGKNKNAPGQRWNNWMHCFKAWKDAGYIIGNIIFDEAHNFKNDEKVKKMFGTTNFKKKKKNGVNDISIDYIKNKCLLTYFQNVMLLSGTPADYQRDLTSTFQKNECKCPISVAIENHWVERPILNLVHIYGSEEFPTAIIKVLEYETEIVKPSYGVRLLANFGSIPEIDEFENDPYIKDHMGKDFHFIAIHSTIHYAKNLDIQKCESMVDGVNYKSSDVSDLLDGIDTGNTDNKEMQSVLNLILDDKPIIVAQVAMIGEGINIRSFNAVITQSNSDTTAMQQMGRGLRKYDGKTYPNIYCVYDNVDSLTNLMSNLMLTHSLTAECFDWGKKIDIVGKGYKKSDDDDDDELKEKSNIGWQPIDPITDPEISEIQYSDTFKSIRLNKNFKSFTESDIFEDLVNTFANSFSHADLQKLTGMLKNSNTATGNSKQLKDKKSSKNKKKTDDNDISMPISDMTNENDSSDSSLTNINVSSTSNSTTDSNADLDTENKEAIQNTSMTTTVNKQEIKLLNGRSVLIEIVKTIRGYVLKNKNNEHIMNVIKEHPDYLIENKFSYIPDIAHKIVESGLCNNHNFLTLIELN